MYIDYKGEKLGQSGPKDAYTEFVKKLCAEPEVFNLLLAADWIYGQSDKESSPAIMLLLMGMNITFIRTVTMI